MVSPGLEPLQIPPIRWSCLHEIGIEYALPYTESSQERLHFPVYAARAPDGTRLIVDELGKEKGIPTRMECRTLWIDRAGRTLYDSTQHGISDGYGCIVDENCIALLRRTRWELSLVARSGEVFKTISLARFSKKLPRHVVWTAKQTFLVVFLDRAGLVDIVELDRDGRMLWYLPDNAHKLGVPGNVQLLLNDNLLLTDEFYHVALEIRRDGSIAWSWGEFQDPSADLRHLSSPKSIQAAADGSRIIADTRNHRILAIAPDGSARVECLKIPWSSPTFAQVLENGHLLVCDSDNGCVVEVDEEQEIVWRYGGAIVPRLFSFPRSVELEHDGSYLIADTAHNRVVKITRDNVCKPLVNDSGVELFWPRCARRLADGSCLIADGRNSRVIQISAEGQVSRTLGNLNYAGGISLKDPHDVRLLINGNLLIADAANDLVVETDWNGEVIWGIGAPGEKVLSDPHSAQQLGDGTILISDTGHHRLIVVGQGGEIVQEIKEFSAGPYRYRFNRPRYAEVWKDNILVVADTGNNRVLAAEWGGELLWELNTIPGSPIPFLDQPRWAQLVSRDEVVVCDHYNHRILHMKLGIAT